jgi:hypothetical protein
MKRPDSGQCWQCKHKCYVRPALEIKGTSDKESCTIIWCGIKHKFLREDTEDGCGMFRAAPGEES